MSSVVQAQDCSCQLLEAASLSAAAEVAPQQLSSASKASWCIIRAVLCGDVAVGQEDDPDVNSTGVSRDANRFWRSTPAQTIRQHAAQLQRHMKLRHRHSSAATCGFSHSLTHCCKLSAFRYIRCKKSTLDEDNILEFTDERNACLWMELGHSVQRHHTFTPNSALALSCTKKLAVMYTLARVCTW